MEALSPGTKRTARTIGRFLKHYFYGMFAKSFNSGITAMDAVIGLAVGSVASTDVETPNWQAAAAVFCVTFIRSCLMYFRENPIPEKLPESGSTTPPMPIEMPPTT